VRALVREPATSDGRIKPGDKIIAVNDIPISKMTHEQAVIFLRQAPDTVRLRLYRHHNSSFTEPPSPSSSCELNYKSHGFIDTVDGGGGNSSSISGTLKRSKLRPEAMSLISDLATRKNTQSSSNSQNSSFQSTANSNTNTMSSPRRLRKNGAKSSGGNTHSGGGDSSDSTLAGEITMSN
jgi:PDZ domain